MKFFAVLLALFLPLVAYYPVNDDREKTIRQLDEQLHDLDRQIEQAQAAQRKLTQFHEEQQRLTEEVEKLRKILPPDPALNEIREVVDDQAAKSGITIDRFQPRQAKRNVYVEVPIDTEAVGSTEALASFFDALSNKSRIIDVADVTLEKESPDAWRAKFLMSAFALLD